MEYLWLYFVLGAAFLRGIISVFLKIVAQEKLNTKFIFLFWYFSAALFLSFFVDFSQILNVEVFLIALSSGLIYYLAPIVSVKALKNLPASMVFVNARIFSTVSILILSFLFFGESLNIKEFVGIVFGFIVFFLLIDRHEKVNLKASFKKGILFLFFYVILLSVVNMIHKTPDLSLMYNYLFIVYSFCFLMFLIDNIINKNIKKEYFKNKKIVLVSIFLGTVEAIIIILYLWAVSLKEIVIIYKIFSFEIFIPIIFSIIYYKEKVTWRKVLAFILTIFSILFFL